eukprot:12580090-Alexandrium_andersonii.AAC.1
MAGPGGPLRPKGFALALEVAAARPTLTCGRAIDVVKASERFVVGFSHQCARCLKCLNGGLR